MNSLPPLPDPALGDQLGPYAVSPLRDVSGSRINADAIAVYRDPELRRSADCLTACNPYLPAALSLVGSFDAYARVVQTPLSDWPLPRLLLSPSPRKKSSQPDRPFPLPPATYVLPFSGLVRPRWLEGDRLGFVWQEWAGDISRRFPAGSRFILSFPGDSLQLSLPPAAPGGRPEIEPVRPAELAWAAGEGFWAEESVLDQFDAALAPSFSFYGDDPIPQSLFGERLVQLWSSAGSAAGRCVVPTVAFRDEDSLRRQLDLWLSLYPTVHTIHLDCLGGSSDNWRWRWLMAIDKHIADHGHIRWLISGLAHPAWVVSELQRVFADAPQSFSLVVPASDYTKVQSAAPSREAMARAYAARLDELVELADGQRVAEAPKQPATIPSFADCFKGRGS